jgi:hypothetical protein
MNFCIVAPCSAAAGESRSRVQAANDENRTN